MKKQPPTTAAGISIMMVIMITIISANNPDDSGDNTTLTQGLTNRQQQRQTHKQNGAMRPNSQNVIYIHKCVFPSSKSAINFNNGPSVRTRAALE